MPISFLLGNVAVIGALSAFAELRTAFGLFLFTLFSRRLILFAYLILSPAELKARSVPLK